MTLGGARVIAGALCAGVMVALTGCGGSVVSGDELFERARSVYLDYRSAVAEVQVEIFDGEWVIDDYGDSPDACGADGYAFSFGRSTPEGWKIDGTPSEAADRLAEWLDENGWSEITKRTYSDGIADVVVEAERPDAHVGHLTVDISPGELYDSTTIYVDSTCEPGDSQELAELLRPGVLTGTSAESNGDRTAERPGDEPSFGRNDDGTPRYWNDKDK